MFSDCSDELIKALVQVLHPLRPPVAAPSPTLARVAAPAFRAPSITFCDPLQVLKPQVLLPSDFSFKAGEQGPDMYFIPKGFIQVTAHAKVGQGAHVSCTRLAGAAMKPRRAPGRGGARQEGSAPTHDERVVRSALDDYNLDKSKKEWSMQ